MSRYSRRGTDCEGGFSEVSMGCEREEGVSRADSGSVQRVAWGM